MTFTISPIASLAQRCRELKGINLAQGSCNLPVKESLIQFANLAITKGENVYSSPYGLIELRSATAKNINNQGYKQIEDENIVITAGGSSALFISYKALLPPESEVIIFEPFWDYHRDGLKMAGHFPKIIEWSGNLNEITEEELTNAISNNTKAILVCSPSNPLGKVFSKKEIQIILNVAKRFDLFIISDEVYDCYVYDSLRYHSFTSYINEYKKIVIIKSFSKQFFITGWRVGYTISSRELTTNIAAVNGLLNACAPTPFQSAIGHHLNTVSSEDISFISKIFQQKRDRLIYGLQKIGTPIVPQGGFFILLDISHLGIGDSIATAENILTKIGVCAVPGEIFFQSDIGKNFLRFCFAVEDHLIEEACSRMIKNQIFK